MALSGRIADWSLADILQMVAAERKSGLITLDGPEGEQVRLEFQGGNIVSAHDQRSQPAARGGRGGAGGGDAGWNGLASYMSVTGRLRSEQMPPLMRAAKEAGGDQFEGARRAGILSPAALEAALSDYTHDLLHRVLSWQSGGYNFVAQQPQSPSRPAFTLNTEGVLLEGMRRIDETPLILDVVRPDTIFRRRPDSEPPLDLKERESGMLLLVDGQRSAGKLARAAELDDYDAARTLFRLYELGLIQPLEVEEERAGVLDLSIEELEPLPRRSRLLKMVTLLVLCAVSLAFRELSHRQSMTPAAAPHQEPRLIQTVRAARLVFREAYGRDPAGAAELRRAGLVPGGYWGGVAQAAFEAEISRAAPAAPTQPQPNLEGGRRHTAESK